MSADTQIYIQNLTKYLNTSEVARELFLSDIIGVNDFINEVTILAMKNVEDGNPPQLTQSQYEDIRKRLSPKSEVPMFIIDGFPPLFLN